MSRKFKGPPVFAVIDVETTGKTLSPETQIVEVAASLFRGEEYLGSFSSLVNPGIHIPASASGIHHIVDEMVAEAPSRDDAIGSLCEYIAPAWALVAHNAAFDSYFIPELADRMWICTWRLTRHLWPSADDHKNQTLRYWLGVADPFIQGQETHRADADTRVTGAILARAIREYRNRFGEVTLGALKRLADSPIPMETMPRGNERSRGKRFEELTKRDLMYWLGRDDVDADLRWNLERALAARSQAS